MMRWLLSRLLWLVVTLLGITFVTFAVIDLAPVDRAEIAIENASGERAFADSNARATAVLQLRIAYGMVDPVTHEPAPLWRRYANWLANAATLRFGGPHDDHAALWRRLFDALPVTMLLGGLALLVAFGGGVPLGAWLGLGAGARRERWASAALLAFAGVPEFLAGTLLLLVFSASFLQWLPAAGLRSPGAEHWAFVWQVFDFVWHLVLPVAVMSLAPMVMIARFVRDSVARTVEAPFVASLRALGTDERVVRRRRLRHGLAPVATLAGSLLPMLVGGSIVVENMFALDGVGHLAFEAVARQDQPMLMAIVVIGSVVTLLALLSSDALHRAVDARVRLQR